MPNEMEDEEQTEEFRTRNLRKTREHLKNLSVDNKHLNFDALYESQNSKIDLSKSTSTSKSVRIFSCLPSGDLRLQGTISQKIKPIPQMELVCHKKPQIRELKNEILSRTFFHKISIKTLLRISLYLVLTWLVLNSEFGGVESIPLRNTEISLRNIDRGLLTSSRTFRSHGGGGGGGGGGRKGNVDHWLEKKPRRHRDQKKPVNKNCKEYDITSRAFLADLIFEGTARSRSRRASGRYVTFVIERILKQKNNLLRPKTQVRLHFGGRATRRMAKHNPLHDCPLNSITNGNRAMINLKIGEKYYVFADHFGLMNYTARGEPIVVNRRNFKSIRSVLRRKKEKPPRVVGLKDLNMTVSQSLRLNCQVRGRPIPRINWYKDGTSLIPSSHVNVTYYRRNSTIEINSLELKDGGLYECRATSVTGKTAKISAQINVWKLYIPTTTDPDKSFPIKKCSVDAYCLNGGQCYFIEHLGEHMCECAAGFKGARCEMKEVSAIGIKSYVCGFNVGYSSYYC